MSLPVQVVRSRRGILELKRPLLVLPVALYRLEKHQGIPGPIAQLVLRQIRGDRVHPGRELFRPIEPGGVSLYSDEDFLERVLRLLPIADRPIDEVQQPGLIALYELLKRTLLSAEERGYDRGIILRAELFSNGRARKRRPLECDLSHLTMPPFVLRQGS